MCGIAGFFWGGNLVISENELKSMVKSMDFAMMHRGPDAHSWKQVDHEGVLIHRRLSILGLGSEGNQPMISKCGRYELVYNGEIFNYKELAKQYGFENVTGTDSEILLQGWIAKGIDFVKELDGFFAFAVWDRVEEQLVLVRDKTGVKPCYYSVINGGIGGSAEGFVFGSEEWSVVKGLKVMGVEIVPNSGYAECFLKKGDTDSKELFVGVQEVTKGSYLCCKKTVSGWQINEKKWFALNYLPWKDLFEKGKRDWQELLINEPRYRDLKGVFNDDEFERSGDGEAYLLNSFLHLSVARRLRSHVPIGFAVSGGLDSAILVAIANKLMEFSGTKPKVFSVQSRNESGDESLWQQMVVNHIGAEWIVVETDTFGAEILDNFINKTRRPPVHWNNLAHFALCKAVKESGVTVLFNGQGADEIFAGYPHYYAQQLFREFNSLVAVRGKWPQPFGVILWQRIKHGLKVLRGREKHYPKFLQSRLEQDYFGSRLNQLLRFEDRNGMAFSLESRNPFADDQYLFNWIGSYGLNDADGEAWNLQGELSERLWNGLSKGVLRRVANHYLPANLVNRLDKKGFTVADAKLTHRHQQKWVEDIQDYVTFFGKTGQDKLSEQLKGILLEIKKSIQRNDFNRTFKLISWSKYLIYLNKNLS